MSSGAPDLFVICKSCGSEVSPYITECPYCGNRLRKRAPKLDRAGRPKDKPRKARRAPSPSLGPLKRGEIPGIRVDARPYATIALVAASLVMLVYLRADPQRLLDFSVFLQLDSSNWWHVVTAAFAYQSSGYAFVTLFAIALFGWLIERRHGPLVVVALFLLGGCGGLAVAGLAEPSYLTHGANGAALALVAAWAVPDLLDVRAGREIEGDLLGAAVLAVLLLLMPVAVREASALAGATGLVVGLLVGLPLARSVRR
ncbi:rhomboid family intramembrane serine protease [Conexibacter sp. CPCC 206217]|uniref:rhomboid family intramembrane serine protease n=1 Tax=Conexibacter sp. CPCC 206217 TaxID=3064574 RepID=UPI0027201CB9|nr:rhomboid family intramembrane serine protease [Conexibacter sp. CPCC 206217]MDO8209772.1 rhomboid family intramembrane serine protease [Conexibacter sp. CPCC 206217]